MDSLGKVLNDIPKSINASDIAVVKNNYYTGTGILITVMLTNYCNYNCYYCIEDIPNKTIHKNLDIFQFIDFVQRIYKQFPNKELHLELYGGEPTLHSKLLKLIDMLSTIPSMTYIDLYTNFSKDIEYYKQILNYNSTLLNVVLDISYHRTQGVKPDQFLQKVFQLNDNLKEHLLINIMYEPSFVDDCLYTYKQLQIYYKKNKLKNNIELRYLYSIRDALVEYTAQQINTYLKYDDFFNRKNTFNIKLKNGKEYSFRQRLSTVFDFHNWRCSAGFDSIYVNVDGKVYPCNDIARIYMNKDNNFPIMTDNIDTTFKNYVCDIHECPACQSIYAENINNEDHGIFFFKL